MDINTQAEILRLLSQAEYLRKKRDETYMNFLNICPKVKFTYSAGEPTQLFVLSKDTEISKN